MERRVVSRFENWFFAFLLFNVANALVSPLEVLYCRTALHASMGEIGVLTASYYLTLVPATLFWGRILDRSQRRREIVSGMLLFVGVCLYFMAIANTVETFITLNLIAGLGIAALGPSATLLIVEQNEKQAWTRKIAAFNLVASGGTVIGLVAASVVLVSISEAQAALGNVNRLFEFSSVLTCAGAIIAFALVRNCGKAIALKDYDYVILLYDRVIEKRRYLPFMLYHLYYGDRAHRVGTQKNVALPSTLWAFYIGAFVMYVGFAAFHAPLPIFLDENIGLSQASVFVIYSANAVGSLVSYRIAGNMVLRHGGKAWIVGANIVRACVYGLMGVGAIFAFSFAFTVFEVMTLYMLSGVFWAFVAISGSSIINSLAPQRSRGSAIGIFGAITGIGNLLGSYLGGAIADFIGIEGTFRLSALLIIVGVIVISMYVPGKEMTKFESLEKENANAFIEV